MSFEYFFQTLKPNAQKTAKNQKTYFVILHPSKGLYSSFSKKKSNSLYPTGSNLEASCRCAEELLISCLDGSLPQGSPAVQEVVGSNFGRDMSVSRSLAEDRENPGQVPP